MIEWFINWMAYDAPTWLVVVLVWLCISPTFVAILWLCSEHMRWRARRRRRGAGQAPIPRADRW